MRNFYCLEKFIEILKMAKIWYLLISIATNYREVCRVQLDAKDRKGLILSYYKNTEHMRSHIYILLEPLYPPSLPVLTGLMSAHDVWPHLFGQHFWLDGHCASPIHLGAQLVTVFLIGQLPLLSTKWLIITNRRATPQFSSD